MTGEEIGRRVNTERLCREGAAGEQTRGQWSRGGDRAGCCRKVHGACRAGMLGVQERQEQGSRGRPLSPGGPPAQAPDFKSGSWFPKHEKFKGRIEWSHWVLGFHPKCVGKPPRAFEWEGPT